MNYSGICSGSKATLAVASETWRLELQPLGVRTITLITSGVKTKSFAEYQAFELPENSSYLQIQDFIRDIGNGRLQANAMDSREYAAKVVRAVEKGTVGQIWLGKDAFLARLGWWLSPRSVFVGLTTFPSSG